MQPLLRKEMTKIIIMKNFITDRLEIDDTIPSWQELGTLVFFSALTGFMLSALLFLAVVSL